MNSSSISTHDLRSHSIDAKRDSESKSKWNPKWANTGSDKVFKTDSSGTKRPKRLGNNKYACPCLLPTLPPSALLT